MVKIKTYKTMKIHYVNGKYKYDPYDDKGKWISSVNTLKAAKNTISNMKETI